MAAAAAAAVMSWMRRARCRLRQSASRFRERLLPRWWQLRIMLGGLSRLHAYIDVYAGSERARKMLSCRNCGKKYHRSYLKLWAQHRVLYIWHDCRFISLEFLDLPLLSDMRGDPTRLMFCKRCDGAYHCYCQHLLHKNVSFGPYLCPKHTRCHSCGSNVPGNGLSVRWFLGHTCCDACGRLFVKGNYCPVCLKGQNGWLNSSRFLYNAICMSCFLANTNTLVKQASTLFLVYSSHTSFGSSRSFMKEIFCSDEKYLQFQVDGNLQYKCATCRGECYQVTDLEDAVQELWRRRDRADRDLIASLRAAAGLPTQEEIFSLSPYSDDDEAGFVMLKNELGRSLKFSLKGIADKSPKKNKEYIKKSSSKKNTEKKEYQASLISKGESQLSFEGNQDIQSQGYC
ncbi:hypothetical protein DITRI_Ditri11bG0180900 [Diplodiscus trichospermus]